MDFENESYTLASLSLGVWPLSFWSVPSTLSRINAKFIKERSAVFIKKSTLSKLGEYMDRFFFLFQNPISSRKIPEDFYNVPQVARTNSRVQHINIQQDESIFISLNLIICQKKKNQEGHRGDNTSILRKVVKEQFQRLLRDSKKGDKRG